MRLEEYWGIGPKTRDLLAENIGVEAALEAIETADVRALTDAGLPRGRATRILRHAHGGEAMDVLATRDARQVYKQLLDIVSSYAVTADAGDRIRILTPLSDREAMTDRLDEVRIARESWTELTQDEQAAVMDAFENYDESERDRRAAVQAALDLQDVGVDSGVFAPLANLDETELREAVAALTGLRGTGNRVGEGADDRLDDLRDQLGRVEDMSATPESLVEEVQAGVRGTDQLREALAREIANETGIDLGRAREAMVTDAVDARAFAGETLRGLADTLREDVETREREVATEYEEILEEASEAIDQAITAVGDIALSVSLARFATTFDLVEPTFSDEQVAGVVNARNLFLEDSGQSVQPITYAVGNHSLSVPGATVPPQGDRVAVLTGANSGGKTTLLETLAQVQLLAQMGLPVPADSAELQVVESIVFHRRHASFNAGVLEATLRSVVPPLSDPGRTLMLVDEFEAITEPGSAADLLHGLVTLTVDKEALGVFVTHLADDLEPLPGEARVDGIFAEGLTQDLELKVDYQPRFETVGRSTPEFIVSRLVADASDRSERAGYETLAEAVGEQAVQRTLVDAKWTE
ncbi:MAG: MutS-related protein [Halovenus sp.]